jgi:hypothetical protein
MAERGGLEALFRKLRAVEPEPAKTLKVIVATS